MAITITMARTKRATRGGSNSHTYFTTNQQGWTVADSYGQSGGGGKPAVHGILKGAAAPKRRVAHVDRLPSPYARTLSQEAAYDLARHATINVVPYETHDPRGNAARMRGSRAKVKRNDSMKAPPDAREIMKAAAAQSLATSGGMGAPGSASAQVFGQLGKNQAIQFLAKMPENLKRTIPPEYRWTESEARELAEGSGQGGGSQQTSAPKQQEPVQELKGTPTVSSPQATPGQAPAPQVVGNQEPSKGVPEDEGSRKVVKRQAEPQAESRGNNKRPRIEGKARGDEGETPVIVTPAPSKVTSPVSQGDLDTEKNPCGHCESKSTWLGKQACYAGCKIKNVVSGPLIEKLKNFGKWLLRQIFENLEGVLDIIQWLCDKVGRGLPGIGFLGSAMIEILKIAPKAVRLATWSWDNIKQKPNQSTSAWIAEVVYKTLCHVALLGVNIGLIFVIKQAISKIPLSNEIGGLLKEFGADQIIGGLQGAAGGIGDKLFLKVLYFLPKGWMSISEWSHILYGGWINQAVGLVKFVSELRKMIELVTGWFGAAKGMADAAYKAVENLTVPKLEGAMDNVFMDPSLAFDNGPSIPNGTTVTNIGIDGTETRGIYHGGDVFFDALDHIKESFLPLGA